MKEKLSKNLGLKLISLFCAFFVWLAVVNVANPKRTDTKPVEINLINSEILERANLAYEIVGKKTATVSYQVKTKDAYKINASDFRVYADLSEMYDVTGAIPLKLEILNHDSLIIDAVIKSPEVLKVQTEELQTKGFPLNYSLIGSPAEGYVTGDIAMNPDYVYVKGPISQVGKINSIGIEIGNVEGTVSDVTGTAQPVFYDANDNKLEDLGENVKILSGDISYSVPILKVKRIPLDFVVTGEVADGYRHTGTECSVKEISVAGLKSTLAALNILTIQSPELSIAGATRDKTLEIDLTQHLPPNVEIAEMEDTTVKVTLKVEPLEDRTYHVDTKDILLTGADSKYDYEISGDTGSRIEFKVRGLKEDLDSLSAEKMNITLDVSELEAGSHQVKASFELDNAYEVREFPLCQVLITEKAETAGTNKAESSEETKEGKESEAESKAVHKTGDSTEG